MLKATCFLLLVFKISVSFATDTLKLTLRQADSIFLKNNFNVLAARLNIDKQKAFTIQAKLYPNPIVTAELNFYDPGNDKFFHTDQTGEKIFQVEQLILLGGKRKAGIELARMNADLAALEFEDLIRQLRYQLHASLFTIHQQKYLLRKYTDQLNLIDTIVQIYDTQAGKGNIAMKEAVRLKSVYLNLNNQRSEIYAGYFEEIAKVQLILQSTAIIDLKFDEENFKKFEKDVSLQDIFKDAYLSRPDYKIEEKNLELAFKYLSYQKKLAVPDLNLFASYDQRGGAFNNQVNAGITIPLSLFNRNQGNIKAAAYSVKMTEYSLAGFKQRIETELQLGYNRYQIAVFDFKKTRQYFTGDFEAVASGMISNFQKRNVTLIEFVDFFESYNAALNEVARARMQLAITSQHLNYLTANEIFKTE